VELAVRHRRCPQKDNLLRMTSEPKTKLRESGLDRAIDILECLHEAGEPMSIAQMSERLGAPRSTIYNIVKRFIRSDILEDYGPRGRIFFGRAVHFYAAAYLRRNDLMRRARDEVDRLASEIGETFEFCTLQGNKYTIAYVQTGSRMFRISSEVGVRLPIPWTASGRLLLAGMTREEIIALVPPEDFILPDGRSIGVDAFCNDVLEAGAAGYAITSGLIDSLTQCLAAPIRDETGKAMATLCAVVTIDRSPDEVEALVRRLTASADRLSLTPVSRAAE
jgi:DNA-binding IclR family transcriptional regulator